MSKDKCKTCGGSCVKSTPPDQTGVFFLRCPDCQKPEGEAELKIRQVRAKLVALNLCMQHNFQPEIDLLDKFLVESASHAEEVKEMKFDFSKGYGVANDEVAKHLSLAGFVFDNKTPICQQALQQAEKLNHEIADLKAENEKSQKEIELLRNTEPNGVDNDGNPIQYRLSN